jgi:integrase
VHPGVSGRVTSAATGGALGRMHSFLDEGVIFMDDGLLDAAHRVLFAVVGQKQQEYPFLVQLREFLKQYVEARPVVVGAEVPSLSEHPGLVCSRCFDDTASRRAALGPFALYDAYRDAVMRAGGLVHARVDLDLLFRVVPADWVSIVAAMISEGPEAAAARAQTAVYDFSLQSVHANRRRGAGRRSASSVKLAVVEARRLFDVAYRLRGLSACERWTYVPEIELPQMPRGGYEVLAPRIEVVRGALQAMTCDIQSRLGVGALEEELAAIDALSDHAMFTSGLWRPMRDRLLLVLMILTGGRKSAIARLRREDYIPDYVGPAPDCRRGAALDLRPQKGKHRDEVRRKPIPRQAALVVDSYLRLVDRWLAGQEQPPAVPSMPLLVAMPGQRHVQPSWIHVRAAGKIGGQRPLVVRDPRQLPKHVTPEEAPYCGYTPHEFRHLANQIAEGAGRIFNERHPATGGEVNPPIPYYAAALLDNGGAERDMRALYGDRKAPAMLEVVAGRATEIGWEILTTGVGLRKRPNVEAYEQELIRLRRIEDEERRLEQAAQRLQAKHARPGPLPALPAGEMGQTNRLEVIMRRQEDLIALVEELKGELLEGSAITHQLVQLSRQKADTIKKLDLYRLDQGTWLAVADTDPPGAEKIDWEAIDKGKLGKPLMPVEGASAVRDWLTFREFCEIIDLQARSTLTRWAKGEHLPARRDRRPWEPEWVPVDDTLGTNYRRIWVPGVNEAFWRTRLRREELANTLSHWPQEQGWTTKDGEPTPRCLTPICVSAPAAQLAA